MEILCRASRGRLSGTLSKILWGFRARMVQELTQGAGGGHLVAFHPRPHIASDLGRNLTCSSTPHRNRKRFPSGNKISGVWPKSFKAQRASARRDWRIASPIHHLCAPVRSSEHPNSQPAGRKQKKLGRQAAITSHEATKVAILALPHLRKSA